MLLLGLSATVKNAGDLPEKSRMVLSHKAIVGTITRLLVRGSETEPVVVKHTNSRNIENAQKRRSIAHSASSEKLISIKTNQRYFR